jgi:hypothetical protein
MQKIHNANACRCKENAGNSNSPPFVLNLNIQEAVVL